MTEMLPGLTTRAETLNQVAARCQTTSQSLADGMSQLINKVEQLGGGGMNGAAYQAFVGASYDLKQGLSIIVNALDDLSGKVSTASAEYGVHDGDAARTIANAASGDAANLLRR